MSDRLVGLGNCSASLRLFIGNRPALPDRLKRNAVTALQSDEMAALIAANSNHWRKIFNLYAKLSFALFANTQTPSWQHYRDQKLLQADSKQALLFSGWSMALTDAPVVNLICGKGYADTLGVLENAEDLGDGFFLPPVKRTLITPYFDYRALSNAKLAWLVNWLQTEFAELF